MRLKREIELLMKDNKNAANIEELNMRRGKTIIVSSSYDRERIIRH
jgi:hypothetical protein